MVCAVGRRRHSPMPPIGAHVLVLRDRFDESGLYDAAVVVAHLTDPVYGGVLELRLSNSTRMQRTWPSSTIRLVV
jgi:hypothetical protein